MGADKTNDMLRSMLWTGMRQELKDVSGYKFDSIKDFDKLRVEMRKLEQEHAKGKQTKQHNTTTKCAVKTEHRRRTMK